MYVAALLPMGMHAMLDHVCLRISLRYRACSSWRAALTLYPELYTAWPAVDVEHKVTSPASTGKWDAATRDINVES